MSSRQEYAMIAALFAIPGIILLVIALNANRQAEDLAMHLGQQASTISSIREKTKCYKGNHCSDTVQAAYTVSGSSHIASGQVSSGSARVSEPVLVLYDVRDPVDTAFVGKPWDIWATVHELSFAAFFCGLAALVFGAIALLM